MVLRSQLCCFLVLSLSTGSSAGAVSYHGIISFMSCRGSIIFVFSLAKSPAGRGKSTSRGSGADSLFLEYFLLPRHYSRQALFPLQAPFIYPGLPFNTRFILVNVYAAFQVLQEKEEFFAIYKSGMWTHMMVIAHHIS